MRLDIAIHKTLQTGTRRFSLDVSVTDELERMVVFGPSGAGKSLLLKSIAGLLRPDKGHIRCGARAFFDAESGIDLPPQARRVGYVFQDYALFPHLTVRQNVAFGLAKGWRNPPAGEQREAVDYWLDAFGLRALAAQYPDQLSGGQQQRTALARALVTQPDLLLLDEPFSALDADLRKQMRAELDGLQQRLGTPMILITHDPEDARAFGGQLLRLRDGRIDHAEDAEKEDRHA